MGCSWFFVFILIQIIFSGIFLLVSEEFEPNLKNYGDSFYYSLQVVSRVGDGQFTPTGHVARAFTTVEILIELIWFVWTVRT